MPIPGLLLLVVRELRKGQEHPPVPCGWWALCDVTLTLMLITVLQLLVVEVHRKGREYPPVMRGWCATTSVLLLASLVSVLEPRKVLTVMPAAVLHTVARRYVLHLLELGDRTGVSGLGFPLVFAGAGPQDREQYSQERRNIGTGPKDREK